MRILFVPIFSLIAAALFVFIRSRSVYRFFKREEGQKALLSSIGAGSLWYGPEGSSDYNHEQRTLRNGSVDIESLIVSFAKEHPEYLNATKEPPTNSTSNPPTSRPVTFQPTTAPKTSAPTKTKQVINTTAPTTLKPTTLAPTLQQINTSAPESPYPTVAPTVKQVNTSAPTTLAPMNSSNVTMLNDTSSIMPSFSITPTPSPIAAGNESGLSTSNSPNFTSSLLPPSISSLAPPLGVPNATSEIPGVISSAIPSLNGLPNNMTSQIPGAISSATSSLNGLPNNMTSQIPGAISSATSSLNGLPNLTAIAGGKYTSPEWTISSLGITGPAGKPSNQSTTPAPILNNTSLQTLTPETQSVSSVSTNLSLQEASSSWSRIIIIVAACFFAIVCCISVYRWRRARAGSYTSL